MKIEKTTQQTPRGEVAWFTITNDKGAKVTLSALGAGIQSVVVPDREGNMADVALGYDNAADYIADGPCAGKTPGRYANRIANGKFTINGKEYSLPINNGPNSLHGGPEGYQNQIWEARTEGDNKVVFTHHSPDGDAGYPGNLDAEVAYTWSNDNTLDIELKAVSDAPTVVNLTNHAYFNLAGHDKGNAMDQLLQMSCSTWLPTDPTQIPLGAPAPVAGTPMDFTTAKPLAKELNEDFEALKIGKGYDHCWMIDGYNGSMIEMATLTDPVSGRKLTVATDQPAAQVYTGNWLEGCPAGKGGCAYHDYDGVAIECQGAPDAPNNTHVPSQLLLPGETYLRHIRFAFSAE